MLTGLDFRPSFHQGMAVRVADFLETNSMIPAAFIYSKSDPWLDRYYTDDVRINCENTGNLDNPLNREFVADGEKHSLVGNTDAVDFVLNFLTKHLN